MAQRKYDQQFKDDVINAVIIGSKPAPRDHDIPTTAVCSWIRGYLLHEKGIQISRPKIGKTLSALGLVVKTTNRFKNKNQTR